MHCPRRFSSAAESFENPAAGDGIYSVETNGNILLVDLKTGTNRTLVNHDDVINVR